MRICGSRTAVGFALLLGLALGTPGVGEAQTAEYLNFDGLTRDLRAIVDGSNLATMESLGTTLGGREIWVVRVGNPVGSPLDERPGVLVVGNLEGDHLAGSQLALESIRYLIDNESQEAVQSVLADRVFYFFPRLNPDGAEAMFASVRQNKKTNSRPWDEDNDGRLDEDGPEDLNGDGYITAMRVEDPAGLFLVDTTDLRAMKKADPTKGESGRYKVYWEGVDNDGDGFFNEDGPGGVDLNRNFQHAYPYWTGDAGPHMVSEVESRALMDFALAHRNIAAVFTFSETDNLVNPPDSRGALSPAQVLGLSSFADAANEEVFTKGIVTTGLAAGGRGSRGGRGGGGGGYIRGAQPGRDNDPTSGVRPATTVATPDQVYLKAVSDAYKRITGIENVPIHRTPEGAFFQYGYFQFGVPSFSTLGWGVPRGEAVAQPRSREGPASGPGAAASGSRGGSRSDASLLATLDSAGVEAFAAWSPFQHPDLGEVEIGGFLPYVTHNPPEALLPELGQKHGEFLVELAGKLPRVGFAGTEVESHGGGLFTLTVKVENRGFFPTSLRHGQTSRSVGPSWVQIQVDDDDILSGAEKTAPIGVLAGSGSQEEVTWLIRGQEGGAVEIRLHSQKAGRETVSVSLRGGGQS